MSTGRVRAVALAAVVLLLAACAQDRPPADAPDHSPTSAELPTNDPTTPDPGPSASGGRAPEVDAAVADLAEHVGVDPADVVVVSREDVTWPDGALGCPRPGASYTQALVPGSRLVLAADGREFAYHAGSGAFTRCDRPQPPVEQSS